MGARAADLVGELVKREPSAVIALPTGRTPAPFYRSLVARQLAGDIELSSARFYQLDEYIGLPERSTSSFRHSLEHALFDPANIDTARLSGPRESAENANEEAERYALALRKEGRIDLAILGLGRNGHIAFNEPGDPNIDHTRVVTLRPETRAANASFFGGDPSRVPAQAITLGLGAIMSAKQLILMADGQAKAAAVAGAFGPEADPALPASRLRRHPHLTLLFTPDAASGLEADE